jgi:AcrR family transcriptional regulator
MPPAIRFSREAVLNAAYELVRRDGPAALNARAVAKELGGSTQPIFRLFSGMDELRAEVIALADQRICTIMSERAKLSDNPYISVCFSYLLFARDEPQLFKLLFMRDRISDGSCGREYSHSWGFHLIENSVKVNRETAIKLYERSFFFAHGLAVCIATKYMPCMNEEDMLNLLNESLHAASVQLGIIPSRT